MLTDALNVYRKQAVRSSGRADIKRGLRNLEETRSSQFVSAWNELLERSSTKQDDRVLILGSILDFDAVKLGALPTKERLPLLIESCAQIPMSLMFNTETNLTSNVHPSRSWLPTGIHGDRLVDRAIITVTVSEEWGRRTYKPDLRDMICIRLDVLIPREVRDFCVNDAENRPKLVLEVSPDDSISARDEQYYNTGCATYLVIDPASGTNSLNGYVGRGARFSVRACQSKTVLLGFDRPLKAWSVEQWRYKTGRQSGLPTYKESIFQATFSDVELELAPNNRPRLIQRRPLKPRPYYAATKRMLYFSYPFSALVRLLESSSLLVVFWPIFAILLYFWWRYQRRKYRRWVKSFLQPSDAWENHDAPTRIDAQEV